MCFTDLYSLSFINFGGGEAKGAVSGKSLRNPNVEKKNKVGCSNQGVGQMTFLKDNIKALFSAARKGLTTHTRLNILQRKLQPR